MAKDRSGFQNIQSQQAFGNSTELIEIGIRLIFHVEVFARTGLMIP